MLKFATALVAGSMLVAIPVAAQTKVASAPTTNALIAAVAGKTCRGYFDFGHTTNTGVSKAAFKFTPNEKGEFPFTARSGDQFVKDWRTSDGNNYASLGTTNFTSRGENTLEFSNPRSGAIYRLTLLGTLGGSDEPTSFRVSVWFQNEESKGEAVCQKK